MHLVDQRVHTCVRSEVAGGERQDRVGDDHLVVRNIFFGCEVFVCVFCDCHGQYDTDVLVLLVMLHHHSRDKCLIGLSLSEIKSLLPLRPPPCTAEAAVLLGDEFLGTCDDGAGLDGTVFEGADGYYAHAFGEVG